MPDPHSKPTRQTGSLPESSGDPSAAESFLTSMNSTVSEHGPSSFVGAPEQAEETTPLAPGMLGRYRLDKLVGKGGFGEVWLAFDPILQRKVAIKFPRNDREYPRQHAGALLDEARRVAELKIPGVAPVYDVGVDNGRLFVVYPFLEGGTLTERMAGERMPHAEAANLVAELSETLHQAHLRNLVHRDIKPANILFDAKGKPFVADFGLATSEREQLKEAGNTLGTFAYMSPEQAAGESHRVDARSDVYSLGVILFELLTARLPYVAESASDYLDQLVNREPRPPRTIDDSIPRPLEQICLKSLAKKLSERYTTAADLAHDLRTWQQQPKPPAPVAWRWPAVGAGLLVVACLAAWVVYKSFDRPDRSPDIVHSPKEPEQPIRPAEGNGNETGSAGAGANQGGVPVASLFPREVEFPGRREKSSILFDAARSGYQLSSGGPQLVQFGEFSEGPREIKVKIGNPQWGKPVGVFLGYREERTPGMRQAVFQAFALEDGGPTIEKRSLLLRRKLVFIQPQALVIVASRNLAQATVDWPLDSEPRTLHLKFNDTGLYSVSWDEVNFPHFCDPEANEKASRADYLGPWGIYHRQGAPFVRVLAPTITDSSEPAR